MDILKAVEDKHIMSMCLDEAMEAFKSDEVPVGAVMLSSYNKVIARAHNQTIFNNSPMAHAEILVIDSASKILGNCRLTGCTLFVTKEPCIMCAGAIIEARIKRVVFGCYDTKKGALVSLININQLPLNHKVEITGGVLEEKSREILKDFFKMRRGTEVVITGPTRNRLYA